MKNSAKVILIIVVFSIQTNAQKQSTGLSKTQAAQVMASFVESVKPAFQKGQSFKDFEFCLLENNNATPEGKALLSKAFDYLSKGIPNTQISKEYSGNEIANAQLLFSTIKKAKPKADGMEVFGGSATITNKFAETSKAKGCKWYQLDCLIKLALTD
jgi:hypothetical protein